MENVMNENVNETPVTEATEEVMNKEDVKIDIDNPKLCSVIPLMFCRVPFNPIIVDWENSSLEKIVNIRNEFLQLRFALISSNDINEIQRIQQVVDETCGQGMKQLGFDIDYTDWVSKVNADSVRQHPSEFCQLLLLNDIITLYDWIITHLKYYHELRSLHTAEECVKIMRSVMFNGEILDENHIIPDEGDNSWATRDDVFTDEELGDHWGSAEELQAEMVRDGIIDDNNNFINNPDNMADDDLRSIINSFNDDHSVSGLID